jgi:mono/diheme cytochrome c family protein
MRRGLIFLLLAACAAPPEAAPRAVGYVEDPAVGRAALVASIVEPSNGYSQLRLAHYATGADGDWDRLLEWNPRVAKVRLGESDVALDPPLDLAAAPEALGEEAFSRYPVQFVPAAALGLASADAADRYGLWRSDAQVGGLVHAELHDGGTALAVTCASCHASAPGVLVPNARFDLGAMLADASPAMPDDRAQALRAWGPGRLDVTTAAGLEPAKIPDLRPVRLAVNLHHDATLRAGDLTTLAVRLETLIITSHDETVRPPRAVALALATYLWGLASSVPEPAPATDDQKAGEAVFARTCAGCHAPPAFAGPAVPIDVVGTDPTLGRSKERGTGTYQVPSLRGLSTRGPLFHDASVRDTGELLDPTPARRAKGHVFGLDLPAADRVALLAYLKIL